MTTEEYDEIMSRWQTAYDAAVDLRATIKSDDLMYDFAERACAALAQIEDRMSDEVLDEED